MTCITGVSPFRRQVPSATTPAFTAGQVITEQQMGDGSREPWSVRKKGLGEGDAQNFHETGPNPMAHNLQESSRNLESARFH
jgi:hypothetical protein